MKKQYLGELDSQMPIGILNTLYEELGIYFEYDDGHIFGFVDMEVRKC